MGFRFRRSITIIPGVRLNLSNGSPSLSVGPRGASISFGSRGTYANIGLAGTGLSYRTRLDKAAASSNNAARASAETKEQLRSSLLASAEQMNTVIEQVINVHTMTPDPTLGHSMDELREHYLKAASQPYSVEAPIRPAKPEIPLPLFNRQAKRELVFLKSFSSPMRIDKRGRRLLSQTGSELYRTGKERKS